MRSTRFNKFKSKNLAFMILLKMVLVWYLIIFSTSYLTSNTAAIFTTNQDANGMMTIGSWEETDESELVFVNKGNQNVKACEPEKIKVKLKNNGKGDMQSNSTYEVHYAKNGNPEKDGEKLKLADGEGEIKVLKTGDTTELTYTANKPGVYAFLANQTNEELERASIWSKWIIVNCPRKKESEDNDKAENKKNEESEQNKSGEVSEGIKEDKSTKTEKNEQQQVEDNEMKDPEKEKSGKKAHEEVTEDNKDNNEKKAESTGESKSEAKTKQEDTGRLDVEQDGEEE